MEIGGNPLTLGRRRIYTKYSELDASNIVDALNCAWSTFNVNRANIDYLWHYYKGYQPILERQKQVRPEICNKVVANHAEECVSFKVGYQLSEPLQYISRIGNEDSGASERISKLNNLMFAEDKASADHDLFEWMCVCGIGFRLCLPDTSEDVEIGGAPFEIYTQDPRYAYTILSNDIGNRVLAGVIVTLDEKMVPEYSVYTRSEFFIVRNGAISEQHPNFIGIPLIEYELRSSRMGVFEPALPILDAINAVESNRLDGIEQTVQSLMKFINCDISKEDFAALVHLGAIKVTSTDGVKGDVEVLKNDLDQTQTQITKEDLYQSFLDITGMPNRNVGSGASDTGAAVLLRDGWTLAESHAKSYELKFKKSERDFIRLVLRICGFTKGMDLGLSVADVDMAFNRRNYDNLLTKSQVLTTMLSTDKVHPLLAFQHCGMFTDPESAYLMSEEYKDGLAVQQTGIECEPDTVEM